MSPEQTIVCGPYGGCRLRADACSKRQELAASDAAAEHVALCLGCPAGAAVRVALGLPVVGGSCRLGKLVAQQRDAKAMAPIMGVSLLDALARGGAQPTPTEADVLKAKVLGALRAQPARLAEIADAAGVPMVAAKKALQQLRVTRCVAQVGRKWARAQALGS